MDSLVIRNRVRIRNDAQKKIFVNILEKVHTVRVALRLSGLSSEVVYRWRKEDETFAKEWDEAIEYSKDALESAMYLKLTEVFTQGGKLTMQGEKLAEFMMAGMRPDKYRQAPIAVDNSVNFNNTLDWSDVPDELVTAFNAGQITLQDVYDRTLQSKEQTRSTAGEDGRNEGSGAA